MSIKSKVLATAATLTLVGGVGTAGVLATAATANAATPSCGSACVDIFSQEFGHHGNPVFILDVFQQHARIGQPIILFRASNHDVAEDFQLEAQGTVSDFFEAGLVTAAFALHFGCTPALFTNCPTVPGFPSIKATDDAAFEIEYTPLGQQTGLCVGVASTAVQGEGVTLQPCGSSSKTVWALDLFDNVFQTIVTGDVPLINGSDTNFSHPFVLTYPDSGFPTDRPRPQLQVDNLTGFTTGIPPNINFSSIDDNQLWGLNFGPI